MTARIASSPTNAYQSEYTLLHRTQQRILLTLAETVYFVNKEDGAGSVEESGIACLVYDITHILHSARHGREGEERHIKRTGYDGGQCCLAHARRSPQDETGDPSARYHSAQNTIGANKMLLTDIILQCARTHSFRQWLHSGDKDSKIKAEKSN